MEQVNTFKGEWKKIVRKWADMNIQYLREVGDFPAWHVEISNAALFSAAAWACKAKAICEVGIDKERPNLDGIEKTTSKGRFDIELHLKEETYLLEAKRRNIYLPPSGGYTKYIGAALGDGLKSKASAVEMSMQVGAMVFFAGSISADSGFRGKSNQKAKIGEEVVKESERFKKALSNFENEHYTLHGGAFFETPIEILDEQKGQWAGFDWPAVFGVCVFRLKK